MKLTRQSKKMTQLSKKLPSLFEDSSPTLKCRFDSCHGLYKRKSDEKPLFEMHCRGDFRLPLLTFLAAMAAGLLTLSLFSAILRRKLCRKKKK